AHEQEFGSVPHRFLPLLPGFAAGERPLELRRMLSGGKNETRRHNGLNASLSAAAIGAALRASGLLEAKQALPFSRCVFCSHPSYAARHCQKRRRTLDLRRMTPAVEGRITTIGDGARTNGRKKEKEAERRQTRIYLLALRQARTLQGALACRRSTAVLPLGLTHPKVRSRTRFRGAGSTMAGVSRRRRPRLQLAPRTPVIVPADMMSDTARVQRGRTLCARAPHPAPASRSHRLTSLHEEREA